MTRYAVKRTDGDGAVFCDFYDDQDECGRDVLACLNTMGVREVVILIEEPVAQDAPGLRVTGFGACETGDYPEFGAEEYLGE